MPSPHLLWKTHSQLGFSLRCLRSQDLPQLLMGSVFTTKDEQMVGMGRRTGWNHYNKSSAKVEGKNWCHLQLTEQLESSFGEMLWQALSGQQVRHRRCEKELMILSTHFLEIIKYQ